MNQRIRYSKETNGVMTSRRTYTTASGVTVYVKLDVGTKRYRIVDAVTAATVSEGGDTINLSVLKIQAKNALMSLGVEFAEELRSRDGMSADTKREIQRHLTSING